MIVVKLNQERNLYLISGKRYPISPCLVDGLSRELNSGPVPKTDVQIKASIGRALKKLNFIQSEDSFSECHIGYGRENAVAIIEFCI